MTRGRKPTPTSLRRRTGNPGKRGYNHSEPVPPEGMPGCPPHLSELARAEWQRIAEPLHGMGVLTLVDRAALAAYCQAYGRWAEAEEKLKETPVMLKTPSGYVQQSPWLSVANKQLELMGRYMAELGITPASRSRISISNPGDDVAMPLVIKLVARAPAQDGLPARITRHDGGKAAEAEGPL
ncbi:MAG: phage terminase small subunit P27 family [Defluviimonas sp.]|nr:phage terminase small subunit P27 family [Defluviimonas sp.]